LLWLCSDSLSVTVTVTVTVIVTGCQLLTVSLSPTQSCPPTKKKKNRTGSFHD
jgi:hypothetical protein